MRNLFYVILLVVGLMACGGEKSGDSSELSFGLELMDSIRVDYLGVATFMDIHPASEKILFYDIQKSNFVVTSFAGQVLNFFSKSGDMPDSFGTFPLTAAKFDAEGNSFTVISNEGVYTYSLEGELIKGGKHQEAEMPAFAGRSAADREFYWVDGKILTVGAGRGVHPRNTPEFYDNYTSLAWFDTTERKVKPFLQLDEASFFKNGKGHDIAHMIPRMAVSDKFIYLIQGIEPALQIYELKSPYLMVRRVDLALEDYFFNQGEELKSVDPRMINPDVYSGLFENLKTTNDYVLTSFFPGIPETQRAPYEGLPWMEMMPAMRKDFPPRLLVLSKEGELLDDIVLPSRLQDRQWLVRDELLWFLKPTNLDEEEDFLTIYQVKLSRN
ncbi:hypothetical protein [Mongoliitalea lutea]|uniref:6-bladed beta-propeller protein n=1 Tax=Mongoliitalea lutea TaxID=849756 RepID=A0A8J3G5M4_9BACT|nr:hypothetical protein [Mongoliitalea lutea]GHB40902.1 hypothetical protein GCM10008106_22530 [Mongoliitalea lutea]